MDDPFVIVGCATLDRDRVFDRIRALAGTGEVDLLAPVDEVKTHRPRRKGKSVEVVKRKAIFFNYVAVQFKPIAANWERLLRTPGIWFVLMYDEQPALVERRMLGGFNAGQGFERWEGQNVAFVSGPFVGKSGTFSKGCVEINGMTIKADFSQLTKI